MRVSDVDILIVPGLSGASEQHWQSRWEAKLSTASRVVPPAADPHDAKAWIGAVAEAVSRCTRPPVIVAHAAATSSMASKEWSGSPRLATTMDGNGSGSRE